MLGLLFYTGPSLEVLHEEYAKRGRLDPTAAVRASFEVLIEAPVEMVWQVLADPAGWGRADPAIRDVHLDAGVEEDAGFTWKNGNSKIRSRFAVVRPGAEPTWTGVSSGAGAPASAAAGG